MGPAGFKARPIGAGPFKFVSQQAGVQMVFEAWEEYWRRTPATKTIVVKGIRDNAARLAGLQTGELDLAFGMTGKVLTQVMEGPEPALGPQLYGPLVAHVPWLQRTRAAPSTTSACARP